MCTSGAEDMTPKMKYLMAVSIAMVTLVVYLPALRNDFVGVWDDNIYIVENLHIRSLDAAFFHWAFLDFYASNWHPLTWISLAADYALWELNPLGYHLTNIILHAFNTLAVVLLIIKLLQAAQKRQTGPGRTSFLSERTILLAAGVTGLLFGLHPLHVESVAWAAERKDLLCALFFLLSIISYMEYGESRQSTAGGRKSETEGRGEARGKKFFFNKHYLLALVFFAFALMSKPMAVSLPAVLLILDWYPFGGIQSWKTFLSSGLEKLPFLIMSLASSVITVLAQSAGESVVSLELVPVSSRVLVACRSLIDYLEKMLLPLNLVPFYPYPRDVSLFSFEYLSTIFLLSAITGICLALVKKRKIWPAVWAYYVSTLIPVLGIVQVGNQTMADRYAYLPSIGPFLAAGLVTAWIEEKVNTRRKSGKIFSLIYPGLLLCLFAALSYATIVQTGIWENGLALWSHAIEKGFGSATAYNNRGLSWDEMGRRDRAIVDFERAIAMDQRNDFAYNNLGVIYGKDGQHERSLEYFRKAIAINPQRADSYCNLGLSYFFMKQYDNALENYNKAIRLKPDFDTAYLDRGNLYFITSNKELALADYRKACSLGNRRACEVLRLASGG
jgi:protein O-mannosyl-transferase